MRLPLVSELVSRDGTTDRDATLKNGLVEINGDQAVTRKRPGMQDAGSMVPVLLRFCCVAREIAWRCGDLITSSIVTTGEPESGALQTYAGQGICNGIAANGPYCVAAFTGNLYRSTNHGQSFSSLGSGGGTTTIA